MTLTERHDALIAYLKQGKFADGIHDFYHDDVVAQENTKPPVQGRALMVANERRFLSKVTAFHGIDIHATAVHDLGGGSGIVFYECTMSWEQHDRPGVVVVDQAVVERWQDGKIAAIRFYGNYEPGELPAS